MNSPLDAFRAQLEEVGLAPVEIIADGQLHRCATVAKPRSVNAAYIAHLDEPPSLWWLDWATGQEGTWTAKEERILSPAERQALQARIEADRRARQEDENKRHAKAADKARRILAEAKECTAHPYLDRKGVKPHPGFKIGTDGRLVVPVLGEDGKPQSLQFIHTDGTKRFLSGGRVMCGYFPIRGAEGLLCICEGLATGLSIHEATGQTVLCAFNAGNLEHVAAHVRRKYPDRELVLCADNDHATDGNPGLNKATAVALAVGASVAVPSFKEPAGRTDFNDLHQAEGLDVVREQLAAVAKPKVLAAPANGNVRDSISASGTADKLQHTDEQVDEESPPSPISCKDVGTGMITLVDGRLPEIVDQCEELLLQPGLAPEHRIFQRGGQLVRIISLPSAAFNAGVERPLGAVLIHPVDRVYIQDTLGRIGRFQRYDGRRNGFKAVDVPKSVADTLLARKGMWSFAALRGVISCPTVRADGSLLNVVGYDPASEFYLATSMPLVVPDKPTRDEARSALQSLNSLLAGFPFVSEVDRAVAFSLILSAIVRPAMENVPLFTTTSPVRGSGKSTLTDIAAVLATGRRSSVVAAVSNQEELRKRIETTMLAGDSMVSLDNMNGVLYSDLLCQATTQASVKIRVLGASQQQDVPNTAVFCANGNNLVVAGDLSRRTLMCKLDPNCERPEEREFEFEPVTQALLRRSGYVEAVLILLRAYVAAGSPNLGISKFGSFEAWSDLVRSSLVWAGSADPCESRTEIINEDPELAALEAVIIALSEKFKTAPFTVQEIVYAVGQDESTSLAESIAEIASNERGFINKIKLGKWFKRNLGRIAAGRKLSRISRGGSSAHWRVVDA